MSSSRDLPNRASAQAGSLTGAFGVRLALWYFGLFVAGSVLILGLAYALLAFSLRARDREVIDTTLVRYARAYESGGLDGLNRAMAADRVAGQQEPLFVRVLAGGESATVFSVPGDWTRVNPSHLEIATARLPDGSLFQIGKSTQTRDEILDRFRSVAMLLLAAIVLAGLAGGRMITWSALRSLRELRRTVESILRTGRTQARVPVPKSRDELAELGVLINGMLDRIEALIAGMRGSLDNVAHDLRTPITRLRATAETALREARSPEEYREALADCLEEAERVTRMLDAVMDIAEAETGAMRLTIEDVDLAAVVRDAVELYADVAEDKQITVDVSAPERLAVRGDRARLTQALANLLDNAIKYTAPSGRVRVTVAGGEQEAVVEVSDNGVGIPAEELPRIWERLFRGDRSRSQRGLGLGLSLVRAIIEAHHGRIDVRSAPGEGSTFTIHMGPLPSGHRDS